MKKRTKHMLRVSKAPQNLIANWEEGVSYANILGAEVGIWLTKAATDRCKLSYEIRKQAKKNVEIQQYRSAVSRYYYAMYHAVRACVFLSLKGDDHEQHSALPKYIPDDFPDKEIWRRRLKEARLARNSADYDPYPSSNVAWEKICNKVKKDTNLLLPIVKKYLQRKGCNI